MNRSRLAIACFVLIVAAALNPVILRMPFANRAGLRNGLTAMQEPPGFYPEYPLFLQDVRSHTQDGDTIALFVPLNTWRGYDHAFYRAQYLLAGREILPVLGRDDRPLPQNATSAKYVALWNLKARATIGQNVIASHHGQLIRMR